MYLPHTMLVNRLNTTAGFKEEYEELNTFDCFLQPVSDTDALSSESNVFTQYSKAFVELGTDVRPNDKVFIRNRWFYVSGVKEYDFGSEPHKIVQ